MRQKENAVDLRGQPRGDLGKAAILPHPKGPIGPGPKPGTPAGVETIFKPDAAPAPRFGVPPVPAVAVPARLRPRHGGLLAAFVLLVLLPLIAFSAYLWAVAEDQYASTTGFTVRQEEGGGAADFLGGIVAFAGRGGASDSDVLYEYIQSQKIVEQIDARLDLRAHYTQNWQDDKLFSLWPQADIEDLLWFWQRMVRVSYDKGSGLIEIRVLAFDPAYARAVAREIVQESQAMINALSTAARADATRYAQADLTEALERLKTAREALTAFRIRSRIVDPSADLQGRLGVMNNLQQQLAEALISFDILRETSKSGDPRADQAARRIEVIRARIRSEREAFASGGDDIGAAGDDYPTLIAEFERLNVDLVYAEETYRASLAALDVARTKAARLSRYLAPYIEPTLAQSAQFPQRGVLAGGAAFFLILVWAIMALVYYSLRDRR